MFARSRSLSHLMFALRFFGRTSRSSKPRLASPNRRTRLRLEALEDRTVPSTTQIFDVAGQGSAYIAQQFLNGPAPVLIDAGPTYTGKAMRLTSATPTPPSLNTLSFSRTDTGVYDIVTIDVDIRITPGNGRADGIGIALLNTAFYGVTGAIGGGGEEPNFTKSFGIGFDIYKNNDLGDIGNDSIRVNYSNSISIHYDNTVLAQFDATPVVDLAGGRWIHSRVIVREGGGFSDVSVILTPAGGKATTIIDRFHVTGLVPYESRLYVGARAGGESADFDIDNLGVQSANINQSVISLSANTVFAVEGTSVATVTLNRLGDSSTTQSVVLSTRNITPFAGSGLGAAAAGTDYTATSTTVTFTPGETQKSVPIAVLNDGALDGDEAFGVTIGTPTGGTAVGGITAATVVIKDAATMQQVGSWSQPENFPVLAVHSALLATGKLMFWDRLGSARIFDPVTDTVTTPAPLDPFYDTFCSGENTLPNGWLFVTGGHADEHGSGDFDGVGLKNASAYDPFTNSWMRLPDMAAGRWYPTQTTLANGDVLVVSGSLNTQYNKNLLPQVWQPNLGTWRDLTTAQSAAAHGADLYPRMFVAPDGRLFKAGPDKDCWWLDTNGTGTWTRGPDSNFGFRGYGDAVMYAPGKILILGGGNTNDGDPNNDATATAEAIDLNAPSPVWRTVASMTFARRQSPAVVLPDGKVLVVGGTGGPGFDNEKNPVLAAELWDPATEKWSVLPSMQVPRGYHGVALLLPDGRVAVGGSGEGAGALGVHTDFEFYSPAYLANGQRPTVTAAPSALRYGQSFFVGTPAPANISAVCLIKLGSDTHAFDFDLRRVPLAFVQTSGGLTVSAPASGTIAPPGFYMLFVLDSNGVPSVARMVQVGDAGVAITESSGTTTVTEGGATDTYSVVLTKQPVANVTVTVNAGPLLTAAPNVLTFTTLNWNVPQTVVVTAVDDAVIQGPHTATITHTATSADAQYSGITVSPVSASITDNDAALLATGQDAGAQPLVKVFDPLTGNLKYSFAAYSTDFRGGVRVATGDVNGDGTEDIITAAGPGGGPHVRVFDGRTGQQLTGPVGGFFAYDSTFTGGVFVASGDVNHDGYADIITGAGENGGPHVKVFDGKTGTLLYSFFAYSPTFTGGVRVASGDVNGDGFAEIITAAGPTGGPHVRVLSGANLAELQSFFAFAPTFTGGVFVAAGDRDGDLKADLIVSTGAGTAPTVRVLRGTDLVELEIFSPLDASFTGGVRVATDDFNGDGIREIIVTPGPNAVPRLRAFDTTRVLLRDVVVFDPGFLGGVFVG